MKRLFLLALLAAPVFAANIKVLIIDGQSGGPYHKWQLTTPVLKKELEETGLFDVDVATLPAQRPEFAKYKVVVSNYDAPDLPDDLKTAFIDFIKSGGGFVTVHAADNSFGQWPEYNEMIGIGGWRNRDEKSGPLWFYQDGKLASDTKPGHAGSHGNRVPFLVTVRDKDHPITRGLPITWMHQGDELYNSLRGPGKNMTVLATAFSDPANHGSGHDEPMLMVLNYGKGRIFHTTLGHDINALSCVGFIATFQRGTEWAATGKVTQKLPVTFPTANTVSYRADIAAMDPNYPRGLNGLDAAPPAKK
jgi:type 1 glutamine amidotransferase